MRKINAKPYYPIILLKTYEEDDKIVVKNNLLKFNSYLALFL